MADHLGIFPNFLKDVRDRSQQFADGLIDSVSPKNIRSTITSITDGAAGAVHRVFSHF